MRDEDSYTPGRPAVSPARAAINRLLVGASGIALTTTIGSLGVALAYLPLRHADFRLQWLLLLAMMVLESAAVHLPSEVILPAGGWLIVRQHGLGLAGVIELSLLAAAANTVGSAGLYALGRAGGRPLVRRFGRYFLVHESDIDRAEQRLRRGHAWAVLLARVLPVVRTYVGFCAGALRLPLAPFLALTYIGSLVWCLAFVTLGDVLGAQWTVIEGPARLLGVLLLAGLLTLLAALALRELIRLRPSRR